MKAKKVNKLGIFKAKSKTEARLGYEKWIKIAKKIKTNIKPEDIELLNATTYTGTPKIIYRIKGYQNSWGTLLRGNQDEFTEELVKYLVEYLNAPKGKKIIISTINKLLRISILSQKMASEQGKIIDLEMRNIAKQIVNNLL